MKTSSSPLFSTRWLPVALSILLLGIGLTEYPRALEKMRQSFDGWHLAKVCLAMAMISIAAFWLGRHYEWIKRLAGMRPLYWLIAAVVLALIPEALDWYSARKSILGLHVYPGLLSVLFFWGWVACVREQVGTGRLSGWKASAVYVVAGLIWSWAIVFMAHSPLSIIITLPVVVWITRGTPLFRGSLLVLAASAVTLLLAITTSHLGLRRLMSVLDPFSDHLGRDYVPFQVRKSLEDAGWFGSELMHHLPNASHQYMLATVGEHWGWLGLLAIVGIVSTLYAILHRRLRSHPDSWFRTYTLGILGTLVVGSCINWLANLGLTGSAGIGIPFLSQSWFLAGVAAFLVGVASRVTPSSKDSTGSIPDVARGSVSGVA